MMTEKCKSQQRLGFPTICSLSMAARSAEIAASRVSGESRRTSRVSKHQVPHTVCFNEDTAARSKDLHTIRKIVT